MRSENTILLLNKFVLELGMIMLVVSYGIKEQEGPSHTPAPLSLQQAQNVQAQLESVSKEVPPGSSTCFFTMVGVFMLLVSNVTIENVTPSPSSHSSFIPPQ